jgi:hypothetical protein
MPRRRKRKCRHCKQLFLPHAGNRWHQKYCTAAACRQASQRASLKCWRRSPLSRTPARRAKDVQRVRDWRKETPTYWKRKARPGVALRNLVNPVFIGKTAVLNDKCGPAESLIPAPPFMGEIKNQADDLELKVDALRNLVLDMFTGLTSQLSGSPLRDVIAPFLRKLTMLGQEIRTGELQKGEKHASETSVVPGTVAPCPGTVQLGGSPPGAG